MIGVCVASDKKRDIWLLFVFVSVSLCNLGYFMIWVSPNLGSALNSNRIVYLGSVFYACIDAVCSLDLTALWTEFIFVSKSEENCYTLSFQMEGGEGR